MLQDSSPLSHPLLLLYRRRLHLTFHPCIAALSTRTPHLCRPIRLYSPRPSKLVLLHGRLTFFSKFRYKPLSHH